MDLQEWEMLSADGFLDFHEDGEGKTYSRKRYSNSKGILEDYFRCPSPKAWNFVDSSRVPNQILPVAIQLDQKEPDPDDEIVKEIVKEPLLIDFPSGFSEKVKTLNSDGVGFDQDVVSQVFFFNKMKKENEFVDTKLVSPRSGGASSNRYFLPSIDMGGGAFQYEGLCESPCSPRFKAEKDMVSENKGSECSDASEINDEMDWEENSGRLNLWKWSMTGIGALCSFGVAAATFCIIVLGTRKHNQQNQNMRFQIYTDEKGIKQVVHHATKLKEAISVAGRDPFTSVHITVGGCYDGI